MGKFVPVSSEEKQRILDLRKQGMTYSAIRRETGRAISYIGWLCTNKAKRPITNSPPKKPVVLRRKYTKTDKSGPIIQAGNVATSKPMIALIGSVAEVTETLKGVFS